MPGASAPRSRRNGSRDWRSSNSLSCSTSARRRGRRFGVSTSLLRDQARDQPLAAGVWTNERILGRGLMSSLRVSTVEVLPGGQRSRAGDSRRACGGLPHVPRRVAELAGRAALLSRCVTPWPSRLTRQPAPRHRSRASAFFAQDHASLRPGVRPEGRRSSEADADARTPNSELHGTLPRPGAIPARSRISTVISEPFICRAKM